MSHTPGPWKQDHFYSRDIVGPDGCDIAEVWDTADGSDAAAEANARLIAAAPDLLAACRALLEVQGKRRHPLGLPDEGISFEAAAAASQARAAIARAEGK